jgi:hypothetical protein
MTILIKEEEDSPPVGMTEVGNFRGLDAIDEGTEWGPEQALSLFYQFIIPSGEGVTETQKRIQSGLIPWITSQIRWEDDPDFEFDKNVFRQVNNDALEILLNSTLKQLNENEYEGGNYTRATFTRMDKDNNPKEIRINYGRRMINPKGLDIEETVDISEQRKSWNQAIIEAKDALQNAKDEEKKELEESIEDAENHLKELEKPSFNDDVKLSEILPPVSAEAQRFYQLYSLDPAKESEAAIALGTMTKIGRVDLSWEENPSQEKKDAFFEHWGITWDSVAEARKTIDTEYKDILGYRRVLEGEDITLDVPTVLGLIKRADKEDSDKIWPVKVKETGRRAKRDTVDESSKFTYTAELDNEEELEEWLQTANPEDVKLTIQQIADKYWKTQMDEIGGKMGEIEIELDEAVPTTNKLKDRPVKATQEQYNKFIMEDMKFMESLLKIVYPGHVKAKLSTGAKQVDVKRTKSTQKLGLKFNTKIPMEKIYGAKVGVAEKLLTTKKHPTRKNMYSGNIRINHEETISDEIKQLMPVFAAREQYKLLRSVLTGYLRRTKSTGLGIKDSFSRENYAILENAFGYLTILKNDDTLDTISQQIGLEDFNLNQWLDKNGNFKLTYDEFINELDKQSYTGDVDINYHKEVQKLTIILDKLSDLAKEYLEVAELERKDEEEEEEEEDIDEDLRTEMEEAQIAEGQEGAEEFLDRLAEGANLDIAEERGEEGKEREIERKKTASTFVDDEDNAEKITKALIQYINDIDVDELEDIADKMIDVNQDLRGAKKIAGLKPSSEQYKTQMRKFLDTYFNYETSQINEIIKTLENSDEELDDDENYTLATEESKREIKALRDILQDEWEELSSRESFREPNKEDYSKVIRSIDVGKALSKAFSKDTGFNDVRHAGVNIKDRRLNLILNFVSGKIKLSGTIAWTAEGQSIPEHKISVSTGKSRTGVAPKPLKPKDAPSRALEWKKITPAGLEHVEAGRPFDETRYDFFYELQNRIMILQQAVKG